MLTLPEAAAAAHRNPDVIRRWLRDGRLAGTKAESGEWLIAPEALRDLATMPRVSRRRPVAA